MNRAELHNPNSFGDKLSDVTVKLLGSWEFIIYQTVIVILWIIVNLWLMSKPFDPYPFILLNLLFSTNAAYSSPLILMAGNRQAEKDRARDELEADEVKELYEINKQQLEILSQQNKVLEYQNKILESLKVK